MESESLNRSETSNRSETLNKKIGKATKWSSLTEIFAKLVSPVTSMILARLLTPEMFGVVATVNVIISFTDMFTDAGFQKYLIQHEFRDRKDREESTAVAFWTNLIISLVLWGGIVLFRDKLAELVGNPGRGVVIAIACCVLPLTSFSSIQMALYKRDFDFKTLFYARLAGIFIPLVVTVPAALIFRNFWALIAGSIAKEIANAVILTWRSQWKPKLWYSFEKLKEMFSFSMWTLFEHISIWMTNYIGTFIVGRYLSEYYVGLYKTSMNTVTQFTTLITAAVAPVLFSTLSRVQNDRERFKGYFFLFQKAVSILIVPMSVGIFLYRDFVTQVLLGDKWAEATMFIGLWGITSCLGIILNNFCSETYRALGKPKLSLMVQIIHLVFLIPALLWAARVGFETLYWTRSMIRLQLYVVQLIVIYAVIKITPWQMLKNIYPTIISAVVMGAAAVGLRQIANGFVWNSVSVILCVICYFGVLILFPEFRKLSFEYIGKIRSKIKVKAKR